MYKVMKKIILRRSYDECLLNEKSVKQNDSSSAQSVVKTILKYLWNSSILVKMQIYYNKIELFSNNTPNISEIIVQDLFS